MDSRVVKGYFTNSKVACLPLSYLLLYNIWKNKWKIKCDDHIQRGQMSSTHERT